MKAIKDVKFEDKFVAFIDVLGFKSMIEKAELGEGRSIAEIFGILDHLGNVKDLNGIRAFGPSLCRQSKRIKHDVGFEITQISDCAVISAEVSPAGVINLISHCWGSVYMILGEGALVRGVITRGNVIHEQGRLIGSGYQNAYAKEGSTTAFAIDPDERGTPFVEVDRNVVDYIDGCGDSCVQEMFSRMVKNDGSVWAVYPFDQLQPFLSFGGLQKLDADGQRKHVHNVKKTITSLIDKVMASVDPSNERALRKTRHYIAALDRQLAECDRVYALIDTPD